MLAWWQAEPHSIACQPGCTAQLQPIPIPTYDPPKCQPAALLTRQSEHSPKVGVRPGGQHGAQVDAHALRSVVGANVHLCGVLIHSSERSWSAPSATIAPSVRQAKALQVGAKHLPAQWTTRRSPAFNHHSAHLWPEGGRGFGLPGGLIHHAVRCGMGTTRHRTHR